MTGVGNSFPHQGRFLFTSCEEAIFHLVFVVSFFGSSSSMETGIAVICQTVRHLLSGDEKNIDVAGQRRGSREECRGQHFDCGWASC